MISSVREARSADLRPDEVSAIRALLWAAFTDDDAFTEEDWQHCLPGTHVLLEAEGTIVAHAAIVERPLEVDGRPVRVGYVEAVAVAPDHQRRGLGSRVMGRVADRIRSEFELGALGTGVHAFYERMGWETWLGTMAVRTAGGEVPTPDEEGYLMVLRTPTTPASLDITARITCDERPGDDW